MHCKFCGFGNGDDDHRCLRCGRRIGVAVAAPTGYSGANALAVAPAFEAARFEATRFEATDTQDVELTDSASSQPRLFNAPPQKVIAFDELQRHVTGKLTQSARPEEPRKVVEPHARKPQTRIERPAPEQTSMDFVPGAALTQRVLKTAVPAQIYCEQAVATPTHRFVASLLDSAMILLAFGSFAGAAQLMGATFGEGKVFWLTVISSLALISMLYGLLWAVAGRETAGMRWTDLQLITFDGHSVDSRTRASRVAATWLSFCSGGLGLIWAMADEENLTWHDHISKTFPTVREAPRSFVRSRDKR